MEFRRQVYAVDIACERYNDRAPGLHCRSGVVMAAEKFVSFKYNFNFIWQKMKIIFTILIALILKVAKIHKIQGKQFSVKLPKDLLDGDYPVGIIYCTSPPSHKKKGKLRLKTVVGGDLKMFLDVTDKKITVASKSTVETIRFSHDDS